MKQGMKKKSVKKKATASKTGLKDTMFTDNGLTLLFSYDKIHDFFQDKIDFSQVITAFLSVPKQYAQQGFKIEVSYETLGICLAFIESRIPGGIEGFIQQFPDDWLRHFLQAITTETLKRVAPKLKKHFRSSPVNTNSRKARRIIEALNHISWGREIPTPTKEKRGRPTKARVKEKKARLKAKSHELFTKKKTDTKKI